MGLQRQGQTLYRSLHLSGPILPGLRAGAILNRCQMYVFDKGTAPQGQRCCGNPQQRPASHFQHVRAPALLVIKRPKMQGTWHLTWKAAN